MLRSWKRGRSVRREPAADELVTECEAFLTGRFGEYLAQRGRQIPEWAWVNRVAHGTLEDVRSISGVQAGSDPIGAIVVLARQILHHVAGEEMGDSEDNLRKLQQRTLIPLELAMSSGPCVRYPANASQLTAAISAALELGFGRMWWDRPRGRP